MTFGNNKVRVLGSNISKYLPKPSKPNRLLKSFKVFLMVGVELSTSGKLILKLKH